jgi:two-component system chemotaxis response regulator CheY
MCWLPSDDRAQGCHGGFEEFESKCIIPKDFVEYIMKVLIVDDSKAMRMIVRRTLTQARFTNIQVIEASNGIEAIKVIEQESPDLVLSDWNMPEMKGMDLLKTLRSAGRRVPLGFITSESSPEIRDQAIESGAAFVIVKPFTPAAIELALKPLIV